MSPTAAAYITGGQKTFDIYQPERKLEIAPELMWVGWNDLNLLHLMWGSRNQHGLPVKQKVVASPKYTVIAKLPKRQFTAINSTTGYAAGATAFTLDAVDHLNVHETLKIVSTSEIVRITAINTSTKVVTVVRAMGTTVAAAIVDNVPVLQIGNRREEFSPIGSALQILNRGQDNYCGIHDKVFGISGTLEASKMVFANAKKLPELNKEALLEIKREMNRTFMFSEPYESQTAGPSGYPIRSTGGLMYWTSNAGNTTSGTTITKAVARLAYQNGFDTQDRYFKVGLAGSHWMNFYSAILEGSMRFKPHDEVLTMRAAQIDHAYGTLFLMHDRSLRDSPAGDATGYAGSLLMFHPEDLSEVHTEDRNLKLFYDQQTPGTDGKYNLFRAESGLMHEKAENGWWHKDYTTYNAT